MAGAALVYGGFTFSAVGVALLLLRALHFTSGGRSQAFALVALGVALIVTGFLLPARESRIARVSSHLDEFMPAWQFNETHELRIAAPPVVVYEAIKRVRADQITLFRALTWIRRGGRATSEGILNPGSKDSIIAVATRSGFITLAEDPPREIVIGTVIAAPRGMHGRALTAEAFKATLPPGVILAAMNFAVQPDGAGSLVTTETRVFASSASARRRFSMYWRVIYPGSALIRRMWLRAIAKQTLPPN